MRDQRMLLVNDKEDVGEEKSFNKSFCGGGVTTSNAGNPRVQRERSTEVLRTFSCQGVVKAVNLEEVEEKKCKNKA